MAGLAGEITVILDSPYCGPFGGPGGESVIGADGHTYMAMLTNHLGRSTLYFYAADGRLAYNEIIEPRCEGMAVLPGEGGDRLLLGCGDTVWAYTLGTGSGAD